MRKDRSATSSKSPPAFVPPGVTHAIYNTGLTDLTFIVVTSPPDDAEGAPR